MRWRAEPAGMRVHTHAHGHTKLPPPEAHARALNGADWLGPRTHVYASWPHGRRSALTRAAADGGGMAAAPARRVVSLEEALAAGWDRSIDTLLQYEREGFHLSYSRLALRTGLRLAPHLRKRVMPLDGHGRWE